MDVRINKTVNKNAGCFDLRPENEKDQKLLREIMKRKFFNSYTEINGRYKKMTVYLQSQKVKITLPAED